LGVPWSEDELSNVFKKFSDPDEAEVHVEDLPSLLRYLGSRPTDEEVQELIESQTQYSSVDWNEFTEFIKRFREYDVTQLRDQFDGADNDGNGTLDIEELHEMLIKSNYSPTLEATVEALKAIDDDQSGTVDFGEFEKMREYLRVNRGFLKSEAVEFTMLYGRVAKGAESKLPVDELPRLSAYIGYHVPSQELRDILSEVDKDSSGFISYDEMLEIIRAIRDAEGQKVQKVIAAHIAAEKRGAGYNAKKSRQSSAMKHASTTFGEDAFAPSRGSDARRNRDVQAMRASQLAARLNPQPSAEANAQSAASNVLKIGELTNALATLGYFVSQEITDEILGTKLKDRKDALNISCEDVTLFLTCYRSSEGFTKKELQYLRHCFEREQGVSVAGADDESLDSLELGRVLRSFGISRTLQQVQRLIEEIDFDGSGQLEFDEFTKLMRQLFHEEAQQRRDIFNRLDKLKTGKLETRLIEDAMTLINGVPPHAEMIEVAMREGLGSGFKTGNELITINDFEKFFSAYRFALMASVAEHAGFIPSEVEKLRTIFCSYAEKRVPFEELEEGEVEQQEVMDVYLQTNEVRRLVRDLIPEASRSIEGKKEVLKMLEEMSPDRSDGLDFPKFLWLMRKCHDLRDERDIVRESEVVAVCEYTYEEVEGLRQLFSSNIDWTGEISLEAVLEMFSRLANVSEREEEEVELLLRSISPYHHSSVRFPDFLMFMRQVVQQNVLGLNDAADRTMRRQAPRSSKPLVSRSAPNSSNEKVDKKPRRAGLKAEVEDAPPGPGDDD